MQAAHREGDSLALAIPRSRGRVDRIGLQDHNRLLYEINNEAKLRRSTWLLGIGTTEVMSYRILDKALAARTAKDQAATDKGKGKRGRKLAVSV